MKQYISLDRNSKSKWKLYSFMFCFLIGCIPNSLNQEKKVSKRSFESYISTLDTIPIPLSFHKDDTILKLSQSFNQDGFNKYHNQYSIKPLGIYYQTKKSIGIIDLSLGDLQLVPILTTYDLIGNKIDSKNFLIKSGYDLGYEGIERITFGANRMITVLDTVNTFKVKKDNSDIIKGTETSTTGKTTYRVSENGKIK